MENSTPRTSGPATPVKSSSLVEWFTDDFYPRYGKQMWVVLAIIAVVLAGYSLWSSNRDKARIADNKKLGAVYVALEEGKLGDAERELLAFLATNPSTLARDKANLYLGKVYYDEQRYDQSLEAYGKVGTGGKSTVLVYSGALHGRAACLMQKKDYAQAVTVLEEFLALCMRRTGNPKENLAGQEVVDLNPEVANALWKQALCYRELHQADKVKSTVEKLRKAYPTSREAAQGAQLLATVE